MRDMKFIFCVPHYIPLFPRLTNIPLPKLFSIPILLADRPSTPHWVEHLGRGITACFIRLTTNGEKNLVNQLQFYPTHKMYFIKNVLLLFSRDQDAHFAIFRAYLGAVTNSSYSTKYNIPISKKKPALNWKPLSQLLLQCTASLLIIVIRGRENN